mgnify:FL=1
MRISLEERIGKIMNRTRRFKALNGARGEYSRIVDKIAIYDENGKQVDCCVIQTDDDGREYYCPSNPHDKFGLFTDKPKDAIECIRNGLGDGFQQSKLFDFTMEHVVRFIDREYGEEIRRKTIEGWKDTKFAYGVKFSYLNSFSGGRLVMKNKTLMGWDDDTKDILSFDNEEDATLFIKKVNEKASKYCEEYGALKRTGDNDWDYEHIFKPFFNRIEGRREYGRSSVYWNAFRGLHEERENGKANYEMEVVQIVKAE